MEEKIKFHEITPHSPKLLQNSLKRTYPETVQMKTTQLESMTMMSQKMPRMKREKKHIQREKMRTREKTKME